MENPPELERTHLELVRQALKLAPVGVLGTLVNASVLVVVLWQSISHWSLIIWFSVTLCLVLAAHHNSAQVSAGFDQRRPIRSCGQMVHWRCRFIRNSLGLCCNIPVSGKLANTPNFDRVCPVRNGGRCCRNVRTHPSRLCSLCSTRADAVSHSLSHHWRGCLHCNGRHDNILYRPDVIYRNSNEYGQQETD